MIETTKLDKNQYYRLYNFGTNFLDRQIIGNQRKLETLNLFPPAPNIFGNDIPSHIASLFCEFGNWVVYESVGSGFKSNPVSDYDNDKVVIVGKIGGYREIQVAAALGTAHNLAKKSFLYGYQSLAYWEAYTYSKGKINLFHWSGQKTEYCYESSYLVLQSTNYSKYPATKPVPWWLTISEDDIKIIDTRQK